MHANTFMNVKIAKHYSNQSKVTVAYFAHTGRWNALLCSCHKNAVRRTDLTSAVPANWFYIPRKKI